MDRVTLATSSGAIWLVLAAHLGAGLIGIVTGALALVVAKGGKLHKQVGILFVYSMGATGILASVIAAYGGKTSMVIGGALVVYFVLTATTTVMSSDMATLPSGASRPRGRCARCRRGTPRCGSRARRCRARG